MLEWVEPIASPHRPLGGRDELIEAYTKLHIFNLTRYSRVLSSSKGSSKGSSKASSKGKTYIQATYI
jgi:hypothetical protein